VALAPDLLDEIAELRAGLRRRAVKVMVSMNTTNKSVSYRPLTGLRADHVDLDGTMIHGPRSVFAVAR
jgi:hypothetical protein